MDSPSSPSCVGCTAKKIFIFVCTLLVGERPIQNALQIADSYINKTHTAIGASNVKTDTSIFWRTWIIIANSTTKEVERTWVLCICEMLIGMSGNQPFDMLTSNSTSERPNCISPDIALTQKWSNFSSLSLHFTYCVVLTWFPLNPGLVNHVYIKDQPLERWIIELFYLKLFKGFNSPVLGQDTEPQNCSWCAGQIQI